MASLEQTLITAAKTPLPSIPKEGELRAIELSLLDDNPFQPRLQMDEDELRELVESIRANGLLHPILVRPKSDGRFTIVAGHRRTAAMRRLWAAAADFEKKKFSRINATIRLALDDGQLAIFAYSENVTRAGLTAIEEGRALERLAQLVGLSTTEDIAGVVNQPAVKVRRLRRLTRAPKFLQNAVESGVMVVVGKAADGSEQRERRALELMAALQFLSLFEHLREKKKLKLDKAEERTTNALRRALAGNWSLRRIEEFVKATVEGREGALAEPDDGDPKEAPVFEQTARRFTIDLSRLARSTREQRAALQAAIEAVVAAGAAAAEAGDHQ